MLRALANHVETLDGLEKLTAEAQPQTLAPCWIPVIDIPTSLSLGGREGGREYLPFAGGTDTRSDYTASLSPPSMGADLVILDPALSI